VSGEKRKNLKRERQSRAFLSIVARIQKHDEKEKEREKKKRGLVKKKGGRKEGGG